MNAYSISHSLASTEASYVADLIDGEGTVTHCQLTAYSELYYAIYNQQALHLLEHLSPYFRTYKAERARIILQEYRALTPHNGKYTDRQRILRTEFE